VPRRRGRAAHDGRATEGHSLACTAQNTHCGRGYVGLTGFASFCFFGDLQEAARSVAGRRAFQRARHAAQHTALAHTLALFRRSLRRAACALRRRRGRWNNRLSVHLCRTHVRGTRRARVSASNRRSPCACSLDNQSADASAPISQSSSLATLSRFSVGAAATARSGCVATQPAWQHASARRGQCQTDPHALLGQAQ
jgi:hypothetical protein